MHQVREGEEMRTIKFRAWNVADKKWIKIMSLQYFSPDEPCIGDGRWSYPFSCIHLMQYTGLKDKNGKEIYEGDIVAGVLTPNPTRIIEIVEGSMTSLCPCEVKNGVRQIEVIGNIYENPELLKENDNEQR